MKVELAANAPVNPAAEKDLDFTRDVGRRSG